MLNEEKQYANFLVKLVHYSQIILEGSIFMSNITREQFLNFIKTSKDTDEKVSSSIQHYLDYFDHYQKTGKKGSWNWAAFWPTFFFFRRMYVNALLVIIILHTFDRLTSQSVKYFSLGDWGDFVEISSSLLFLALIMRYADYIYLNHASKKISKGILRSGTSKTAFFISLILAVFAFCVAFLMEASKM
jgi:hypothetical protein